ncbi:hypothetical protein CN281_10690 [Bacillus cereus]|nr:hypothetical protein CN281_10690 [Bacillus cereus]PFH82885.1 hypothetical protein COI78_30625 [Bacillus cereus]
MRVIGFLFFPFGRKGGDIFIGFLFELLKEFVKAIVREVSAYVFRKQILEKDNNPPIPRRRRNQKGGVRKK